MNFTASILVSFLVSFLARGLSCELSPYNIADKGEVMLKVTVSGKNSCDELLLMLAAVDGVLFAGYEESGRIPGQKPVVSNDDAVAHNDYFQTFFDAQSGNYADFAELVPGTISYTKMKKGVKTIGIVMVKKDRLRECLEKAGVIRKLWN